MGKLHKGLYQMDLSKLCAKASASTSSKSAHSGSCSFVSMSHDNLSISSIGKIHQKSHISQHIKTTKPFQLIHSDLWGPTHTPSPQGYRYYIHFIDDYSRYTWIYPLTLKSEACQAVFFKMVQCQFSTTIQAFQSDWGGEYRKLVPFFNTLGVHFQHPCPHIHPQNGKAERKHQHIVDVGLTLLNQVSLPLTYWWHAFEAAIFLINRLPTPTLKMHSPFQVLFHKIPDYSYLKVFGCTCFPYLKSYNSHKLQFRSTKCIFLGYSSQHKGYKCLSANGRIYIAYTVHFNESEFPYVMLFPASETVSGTFFSSSLLQEFNNTNPPPPSPPPTLSPPPSPSPPLSPSPSPTSPHSSVDSESFSSPSPSPHPSSNTHSMITRSKHGIVKPKLYIITCELAPAPSSCALVTSISPAPSTSTFIPSLPLSLKEALSHPGWLESMSKEFDVILGKGTWLLIPPDPSQKVISNKWVFRVKLNPDYTVDKLKARLVARGFEQLAGVDFVEIFSPVVKPSTIRLVFSLAATKGWAIQQIDVNNAFLNGELTDTIYMAQPAGFEDPEHPNYVCKLQKTIYGLKQAPRAWYDTLRTEICSLGFTRSASDFSLFFKKQGASLTIILVYVDDILITGDDSV